MRRKLTRAQRRVVADDSLSWVGWDSQGRPVVSAWFYREQRMWAIEKNGERTRTTGPVEHTE